jgi:hypothetical protein
MMEMLNNLFSQTWFWVVVAVVLMYLLKDKLLSVVEGYQGDSDGLGELSMDQWELRKQQQGK